MNSHPGLILPSPINIYILPPRGCLRGPWEEPVDSQDGQRRGEWKPRRPHTAINKTRGIGRGGETPHARPNGIPPIKSVPPFKGNVSFTTINFMFLLIPLGWSKVLLCGVSVYRWGGASAPPRAPGGRFGEPVFGLDRSCLKVDYSMTGGCHVLVY